MRTFENVQHGHIPDEIKTLLGDVIEQGEIPGTYHRTYMVCQERGSSAQIEMIWHTHDGQGNDRAGITDLIVDRMVNGKYMQWPTTSEGAPCMASTLGERIKAQIAINEQQIAEDIAWLKSRGWTDAKITEKTGISLEEKSE